MYHPSQLLLSGLVSDKVSQWVDNDPNPNVTHTGCCGTAQAVEQGRLTLDDVEEENDFDSVDSD